MSETVQPASLTQKTVSGAAWSGVSRAVQQGVQLLSTMILARLLGPSVYGLMAMASFFTNLLQQIGDLGTGSAVIQRDRLEERFLSSVFWLNVAAGSVAAVIVWIISPWAVKIYREPELARVLSVLALSFPIAGAGIVQQALLVRAMEFRKLAVVEIGSAALSALVGIVLAWNGAGVWSLVASSLTLTTTSTLLSWLLSGWWPRLAADWSEIASIASFSLNLTGFVVVNYFARNAGHLVVGRLLGSVALGYYQMAYTTMLYPVQNVTSVLGRVLFSALAQIQNDHERFRAGYLRASAVIAAITFPMMLGIMVTATPLVTVVLGAKWAPVAPLLLFLAPVGLFQSVASPVGQIFLAKGRTDLMLRLALFFGPVQIAGYLAGSPWGLQGVAIGYAVANLVLAYPNFAVPFRLVSLRLSALLAALAPGAAIAAAMAAGALGWRMGLEAWGEQRPRLVLITTVLVGILVYVALLLKFRPPVLADLAQMLAHTRVGALRRLASKYGS